MPYRDARTPLLQRKEALARDLAGLDEEMSRAARLAEERATFVSELAAVEKQLADMRTRALPLLSGIKIAAPCSVPWESMAGDDRVRSCGECELEVFDVARMTEDEAESFLEERVGKRTCVRLHRRADGTILTRDCEVGARRRRRRIAGSVVAMVAAGIALAIPGEAPVREAIEPSRASEAPAFEVVTGALPSSGDAMMGTARELLVSIDPPCPANAPLCKKSGSGKKAPVPAAGSSRATVTPPKSRDPR